MNHVVTILLAVLLLAMQSSGAFPLAVGPVSADLALCLTVHLAFTRTLAAGGALAAGVGYLTDVAAGSPSGLHMVAYTAVFLGLHAVRQRVFLNTAPAIVVTAVGASLAATALTWALTAVFLRDYFHYWPFLLLAGPRALLTAPWFFLIRAVAGWLDHRTGGMAGPTVVHLRDDA